MRDPDDVVDAFAAVFGVTARAGQTLEESLVEFLRTKQLLLVVDNCEHVLDAVAELVEEIGRTCPGVAVLATSREGLALDGERMLAVPSLAAPDADADLAAVGSVGVRCSSSWNVPRQRTTRFVAGSGQRRGGRSGVSSSRWGAARDRAGGGAGALDEPGGARRRRWIIASTCWLVGVAER